jgi:fucose permease
VLPLVMAALSAYLVAAFALLKPQLGDPAQTALTSETLPFRFWLYSAATLLYGVVETLAGNWAVLYLSAERHIAAATASFALTAFWSATTIGRIIFAFLGALVPSTWVYVALPVALAVAFQLTARADGAAFGIAVFAAAGFACSALLPLSISLSGSEFPKRAATMSSALIAFYQVGYGIAAFGVGPLHDDAGLSYASLYSLGSIVAVALAIVALAVARRSKPRTDDNRPVGT